MSLKVRERSDDSKRESGLSAKKGPRKPGRQRRQKPARNSMEIVVNWLDAGRTGCGLGSASSPRGLILRELSVVQEKRKEE